MTQRVAIVGAGLCGNLLAILLARRGCDIIVYEQDPEPGLTAPAGGRSINLALAARGIHALEQAGVFDDIRPLLLPMFGRIVHERDGTRRKLPYGQHADEQIWSVSRHQLNERLQAIARQRWHIEYRFGHACAGYDTNSGKAQMTTPRGVLEIEPDLLIAADGAGSVVRRALAAAGAVTASEDLLDHGYKEILVPAAADGDFALDPKGLHIWPRGGFMLIALPNPDCTFTATLFLPHRGAHGFDTITAATVREFFAAQFPDALPLMPELGAQFAARPVGVLGTIHCRPWQTVTSAPGHRQVLLIGDAAHAIVPFHGQGMNAAFEDCAELDRLLAASSHDWAAVLREFEAQRRPNAEAIARMALENYTEMRDGVRDPRFAQRADIAFALERQFPGRFIPRYSMVMFHPEIAYAEAERRGRIQAELLDQAMQQDDNTRALARAAELVAERL